MSVIYDALQKAENQNKTNPGSAQKKKKNLVPILGVVCVIAGIIFILNYLPKKKPVTKAPEAPAVAKVALPAVKEETLPIPENPSENYILEGIIYSQEDPIAIINGKILKRKDKIDDFEIKEISPNSVELTKPSDSTSLDLTLK